MSDETVNTELEIIPKDSVQLGMLRADSPTSVVDIATRIANKLTDVMNQKHLYADIKGKKFPTCEAWTTCAAMLGISPKEESVTLNQQGDYEARVALIDSEGKVVGGASASCGLDEEQWKDRLRFARRSMSITRATSKACRLKFSWIMTLAGFEPTPAEEMQFENHQPKGAFQKAREEMKAPQPKRFGNWRDCIMHFSKNSGKTLGQLTNRQLSWYHDEWMPKRKADTKWPIKDKEQNLFDALEGWRMEMNAQQQEDEIPMDYPDSDNIPPASSNPNQPY